MDETGAAFTINLFPGKDACLFLDDANSGEFPAVLDPGGIGLWRGAGGTWNVTPSGFEACFGTCFSCDKKAEPAPGNGSGHCKGEPDACSAFGAGSCSPQKGCYFASSVKYDGSLEYHCTGTPVPCNGMLNEQACSGHGGCVWEPQ